MGKLSLLDLGGLIMLRSKDFYMKSVYDICGKRIGIVEDIFINFYEGKVTGLYISNYSLFSKKNFVSSKDIITIDKEIIVRKSIKDSGIRLKDIKGMEIIDLNGNIKGAMEDLIIREKDFSIKGLLISAGIIDRLLKGKEILLINQCVLGEEYILYTGKDNMTLKVMPRKVKNNEISN